jgi:hypothetical protein
MVIDLTRNMVASSVISRLVGAVAKLSAIVKIRKYKGFRDMNHFIKECAHFFHDK